jgi:pilus assembly protein Flp/PilA
MCGATRHPWRRRAAAPAVSQGTVNVRADSSWPRLRTTARNAWHSGCDIGLRRASRDSNVVAAGRHTQHGAFRAGRIAMSLISYLRTFARQDEGQDLLEYALLVSLIAIAAIVAVTSAGTSVSSVFTSIAAKILPAS